MTSFIVILLLLLPSGSNCDCHPVKANQTSYGANLFILVDGFKVSEISGKVSLRDGADPVVDAIVEVFKYSNSGADYKDVDRALAKKRRAACATGNDGAFCFSDIPS